MTSDRHTSRSAISRERAAFWRAAWRAVVRGRCPHCGQTRMFSGFYTVHERCGVCDLRYEAQSGAWLGALAFGYTIGAAVAILLVTVEVLWEPIRAIGLPPLWTIAVLALVATAVGYRWAKAAWFVFLYYFHFMAFGDAPPGPSLEEIRRR